MEAAGSPSEVFEIIGGNHSQYTDTGQQIPLDGLPQVSLATQQDVTRRYVIAWFGTHVKGQVAEFSPYVLSGAVFQTDARIQNRAWK